MAESARKSNLIIDQKINFDIPEIVCVTKSDGPLTKEIRLDENGEVRSDGSACLMARGTACRMPAAGVGELAALIGNRHSDQAIALGSLRADLADEVEIVTKREIERANGAVPPNVVSRSADNILFVEGRCGFVLLDFDTKGMPADVAERLEKASGFWPALVSVIPELAGVARVTRASTSAGLYDRTTGEPLPGSNGRHDYLMVRNVADSVRFLKTLHARCWLAGYGWFVVGASGQLLERSVIDRMVGAPERLVFEGPPVLFDPLVQDTEARRPRVVEGATLDTPATCPPLRVVEDAKLTELHAKAKHALAGEVAKAREKYIARQTVAHAERAGVSDRVAREIIRRQCDGLLTPTVVLPFDDPALAGRTVADVLADPAAFEGETLADPLEGVEHGRCKARIMLRPDGTPWVLSFAHGRTIYELKFDAAAVRAAIDAADKKEVVTVMVDLLMRADVDAAEEHSLIAYAKDITGTGVRVIAGQIRNARRARADEAKKEAQEQRLAVRTDPRPILAVPALDAEFMPVMDALNAVIAKSTDRIPPGRDVDGNLVSARKMVIKDTHAFVRDDEDRDTAKETPPQWVLHALSDMEAAEMIERHINFVDDVGRSVHCPMQFVKHYMRRDDGALPRIHAVAALPLVSADGHLIYADGLDRERGIVFNIPPGLTDIMPCREDCNDGAVAEAMRFLLDDWLADVATDYVGKCSLVVLALLMIEGALLDKRPACFVTAGAHGSGKTTAIQMIVEAVTGTSAAASALSPDPEERRKALLAYFLQGVPYILWDNVDRGTQISCPHIERACTSEFYGDRRLGSSETVQAPATAIQIFNGNNVGPKGDLTSRSLQVRLDADRVEPANRNFKHPDVIGWTRGNRSRILAALYVVMLGNPLLDASRDTPMKTRFSMAYRLVGSAVEHAALCAGQAIDFGALFHDQDDDEFATSLAEMLPSLSRLMARVETAPWFKAADVVKVVNDFGPGMDAIVVRDFLYPTLAPREQVTAKVIGKRLRDQANNPVKYGGGTLVLKAHLNSKEKIFEFRVEARRIEIEW